MARPLWHDEIFTIWMSRLPFPRWIEALSHDSGPPLFYLVTRPFTLAAELWSAPDVWIRAVPFLAAASLFLGARSLPRGRSRAAFVALLATSFLLTFYATEARAYALLAALDLGLFLLLRSSARSPARYAAIALCTAAALSTHYLAIFFVVAAAAVAVLEKRLRDASAVAAGAVLFLPWVPVLLRQPAEATAWLSESPGRTVAGFLSTLGGVGRLPPAFGPGAPPELLWLGAAAGVLLLVGLASAARAGDREIRAAALVVAITLAGAFAAGLLRPVAFAGRTEMAILPVWIWAVARGVPVSRLARAGAAAAGLFGVVALTATLPVPRQEPSPSRVAAVLERLAAPADLVVAGTAFYLPLRLARERGTLAASLEGLPADLALHPGWFPIGPATGDAYEGLGRSLASRPPGARVWIAVHPLYATPRLGQVLESGGEARPAIATSDALVLLWTAGRSSGAAAGAAGPATRQGPLRAIARSDMP